MLPTKTTLKDVARLSGVSTATVSYVLNSRSGDVSPETRSRVLQVMRDLNYQPRALVRGDRAAATRTVGVMFQNIGLNSLLSHPYAFHILDGVLSVATTRGWHVTLFTTRDWHDIPQSLRTFCDGRCDGLLLVAPRNDCPITAAIKERGLPFVVINSHSRDPEASSIDIDQVGMMAALTRKLLEQGHRRIAYLCGEESLDDAILRREGFAQAMTDAGIAPCEQIILPGGFYEKSGYENALLCLDMPTATRPTALCCGNDMIAVGAYQALKERGVRVPHEMSVVGFDDMPYAAQLTPPLTTVGQPFQSMGEQATRMLLNRIASEVRPESETEKIVAPAQLIERSSVAAPRTP